MEEKTPIELYIEGKMAEEEFLSLVQKMNEDHQYPFLGLTEEEFAFYKKLGSTALVEIIHTRQRKLEIIEKQNHF